MRPRVSIGVPVFNGARYLAATLDSILAQTFADFEVIISDNASTDRTPEICALYQRRDSRIRYYRNDVNLGSARNFDRTVDLATGEYFKCANADDLCEPTLVAECVAVLDAHPEVVLCYGRTTLIDEHGGSLGPYEDRLDLRSPLPTERFRQALAKVGLVNVLQGVMRLDALRRTGVLGKYVGSDVVLVVELTLHGQFYELPEFLFSRRLHDESESVCNFRRGSQLHFFRHYVQYLRAIWRSRIRVWEKAQLTYMIVRMMVASRRGLAREVWDACAARWKGLVGRDQTPALRR